MKNTKEKVIKEYEDAPSGSVYFYNYKEPLMPFEGGFGFNGALIFDDVSDRVQCHFCGEWYHALGHHLHKEHNMTAQEYKSRVGLNVGTALIGEGFRAKLIASGMENRLRNLRPGVSPSNETREKIRQTLEKNCAEKKNLNNTCPDQLIKRLVALYKKLGRTPTMKELSFKGALFATYGNMYNACSIAGIPYRAPCTSVSPKAKYSIEFIVNDIHDFYKENGRFPKAKEKPYLRNNIFAKIGVSRKDVFTRAVALDGVYRKLVHKKALTKGTFHYTNEELINFLVRFQVINGRRPSSSDHRRGLLPAIGTYVYRFGSWKKAMILAGYN